jgi:hypothetical protein
VGGRGLWETRDLLLLVIIIITTIITVIILLLIIPRDDRHLVCRVGQAVPCLARSRHGRVVHPAPPRLIDNSMELVLSGYKNG